VIISVKLQSHGYLVNGTKSVPNDSRNRDYREVQGWIAEGNTPEPADPQPDPRIAEIDAELAEIDRRSVRAMREGDRIRTDDWEAKAVVLRAERKEL